MTVAELIARLKEFPESLRMICVKGDHIAVRDLVYWEEDGTLRVETVVLMADSLYGYPPLTEDMRVAKTKDVLERLTEDPLRFGSGRVFCSGHKRIVYSNMSNGFSGEDWKYGDTIDPRIWKSMLDDGLLEERTPPGAYTPDVWVTAKGRAFAAELRAGAPT